ncbi:MAG: tetratricopeptide repeat protein [Armatimonadota bacterium]
MAPTSQPQDFLEEDLEEIDFLCRQRDYPAARQIARRLLRNHPANARVHEVMGDICAADGDHAEAVEWYERTMEIEPSQQLREKLLQARRRSGQSATRPPGGARDESARRYRIIAMIAGGIVVVLVVALLVIYTGGKGTQTTATTDQAVPRAQPISPRGSTSPGHRGASSDYATPRSSSQHSHRSADRRAADDTAQRNYKLPPVILTEEVNAPLTQQDRTLLAAIASLNWPGGHSLSGHVNVMTDPFNGYAFITVSIPKAAGDAEMFTKVVGMAFRLAKAAAENDSTLRYITIRIIIPIEIQKKEQVMTIFRGNVSRKTLDRYTGRGRQPETREIWTTVFADCWWNPSVPYSNPYGE